MVSSVVGLAVSSFLLGMIFGVVATVAVGLFIVIKMAWDAGSKVKQVQDQATDRLIKYGSH